MALLRLLIFALVIWLVWRLVKNKLLGKGEKSGKTTTRDNGRMVRCSFCETHLPQSQALQDADDWFCSMEHKNKARNKDRG